jgi:cellulose 1,4-beta-cellobiosidase
MATRSTALILLFSYAAGQQYGTLQAEVHPSFEIELCTDDGCKIESKNIVVDANWRWVDAEEGNGEMGDNCYLGNAWDATVCPDSESGGLTCAQNCNLEGADDEYINTYGITAESDSLTLGYVTETAVKEPRGRPGLQGGTNVGSRTCKNTHTCVSIHHT